MDSSAQSPESPPSIVVGVDSSEPSELAARWAGRTASQRGWRLRIVHGYNLAAARTLTGVYYQMERPVLEAAYRRGNDCVEHARSLALQIAPSLKVETELSDAEPARLLVEESASAELTVIGASGEGSTLAHLGSTLLAVTSHGHGKVVVVRGHGPESGMGRERPVVVGLDGTSASHAAAAAAFAEADLMRAPLVALHAWHDLRFHWFAGMPEIVDDPDIAAAAEAQLSEWLAEWTEKYPDVEVINKIYLAGPDLHLIDWSKSAQLVVVGSRGRGGFHGLLMGSTSNIIVQRAHCPVLVAHQT
ncbi:universal stress protein [Nocardia speluncae]|uniref:Universal stress protein n=1 Tax=Nocardia speluncae TaxID=419477 RepID=A0A846XAD5_9NOCA|nr:universal stress protein [Nocardia speluncae]NKY32922.1 universal stress protein [Nocardia speluncae]